MTIIVKILGEDRLAVQWPCRLSEEVQEAVWWLLEGVDYIDHIERHHYTTHLRLATHLAEAEEVAEFVANALVDDDTLAELFDLDEFDEFGVSIEY